VIGSFREIALCDRIERKLRANAAKAAQAQLVQGFFCLVAQVESASAATMAQIVSANFSHQHAIGIELKGVRSIA